MRILRKGAVAAAAAVVGVAWWWRKNPSACPYNQRFWVQAPHPFIRRDRLITTLEPKPGERLLEIGPGTGYYTLDVARALEANGTLHIFDLQQDMLDHTMRRATEAGLSNIVPQQGNAEKLPYDDKTFDGAYLVTVLGEIPDRTAALREMNRVLKANGRLVVGELFGDPHMVTLKLLEGEATEAGFSFEVREGPTFGSSQDSGEGPDSAHRLPGLRCRLLSTHVRTATS